MVDLVITATLAAALLWGVVLLAYDAFSTVAWRRDLAPTSEPVQPEPATDLVGAGLPVPAVEALSP